MFSLSNARRVLAALLLAVGAVALTPAWADDYGDVQQLANAGQTAAALSKADSYISAHPNDPQMRFIKANILSSMGRTQDAQKLLEQLTQQYPELPEPWNNLAVLYAAQGKLNEARSALDSALRIRPDYATALENLGDLRVREALQAYERAHALDPNNAHLAPKITQLQALVPAAKAGAH